MKQNLQNRISRYTAVAATLVGASTGVNAQIVYTDVVDVLSDPVEDAAPFVYGLDVDNDLTVDFVLFSRDTLIAAGPAHLRLTLVAPYGTAGNAVAGDVPSAYNYAFAMNLNDAIDNTLNWIAATNTMAYNVDSANPYNSYWNGVTDKYLGLQFKIGTATHYGWARLDVSAIGDVWTLKDYAYNGTADAAINAGQMTGLNTLALESLLHFVNQENNTVKVVINGDLTNGTINLVSTTGQIVSSSKVDSNESIVDLNGLASGVYVISATFAEGSMTKKVIVR